MNLCKDCRNFIALGQRCVASREVTVNPVTGNREPRDANFARSERGLCGPTGRFWEADTSHLTSTPPAAAAMDELPAREFPA